MKIVVSGKTSKYLIPPTNYEISRMIIAGLTTTFTECVVQPMAVRSTVSFGVVSFLTCASAVAGCQAGYERMALMYCLYTCVMSALE